MNYTFTGKDDYIRDYVTTTNGKWVVVDTAYTVDRGWETMVFRSDGTRVIDFMDLEADWYDSYEKAMTGHRNMVAKWKGMTLV